MRMGNPIHWRYSKLLEDRCARRSDATVAASDEERDLIESVAPRRVHVVPTIHDPRVDGPRDFERTSGVLFIGAYDHRPNVDAALLLAKEIMPEVWRRLPGAHLTLLGSHPPLAIRVLASERVSVPGFRSDVGPHFLSHRVFVAPLRYGAGLKGKIGQSLSYALPTITSSIGAEGFHLKDGVDFLLANAVSEFVEATIRVYTDGELWRRLASNSLAANGACSTSTVTQNVLGMLDEILTAHAF